MTQFNVWSIVCFYGEVIRSCARELGPKDLRSVLPSTVSCPTRPRPKCRVDTVSFCRNRQHSHLRLIGSDNH